MAEMKVTIDTALAWALIPEGTLHTTGPFPSATPLSFNINKQLWLCDFASMLQRMNKSGAPSSIFE